MARTVEARAVANHARFAGVLPATFGTVTVSDVDTDWVYGDVVLWAECGGCGVVRTMRACADYHPAFLASELSRYACQCGTGE